MEEDGRMGMKELDWGAIIGFILVIIILLAVMPNMFKSMKEEGIFGCTEYEQVPYRTVPSLFGVTRVETVEENRDGYMRKCVG